MPLTYEEKVKFVEDRGGYINEGVDSMNSAPGFVIKEWRCEIGDEFNIINGEYNWVDVFDWDGAEKCLDRAIAEWNEKGFRWIPRPDKQKGKRQWWKKLLRFAEW